MNISIGRSGRVAFACTAMAAFAGAMSTAQTPAHVRRTLPPATAIPTPPPAPVVVVVARRDPFAGAPSAQPRAVATGAPSVHLPPPPAFAALPPNAGALGMTIAGSGRVSAIATGAHPFALVEDGQTTRLIAVGDSYSGRRVAAIDAAGVRLDDGTLLGLTRHEPLSTVRIGAPR